MKAIDVSLDTKPVIKPGDSIVIKDLIIGSIWIISKKNGSIEQYFCLKYSHNKKVFSQISVN